MIRPTALVAAAGAITVATAACSSSMSALGTDSVVSQKAAGALKKGTGQVLAVALDRKKWP